LTTSLRAAKVSLSSLSPNNLSSLLRRLKSSLPVNRKWKTYCAQNRRKDELKRRKTPAKFSNRLKRETLSFKILNMHQWRCVECALFRRS
jgi:hypothetical protein